MYKRLKHGEYQQMTPEQQLEHRHFLQKRWRDNNPDKIKATNARFAAIYQKTKPHTTKCTRCGKTVAVARSNQTTMCADCHAKWDADIAQRKENAVRRIAEHQSKIKQIIDLYKLGYKQMEIATMMGILQTSVSYYLRTNGIDTNRTKSYYKQRSKK